MRRSPSVDRHVRIELLRARAAIERETLARRLAETGQELAPTRLVRSLLPGVVGKGGASSLLLQAIGLARRHPLLSSALPTLLMGRGRRGGILRLAAVGLAGWQLFKAWQKRDAADARAPADGGQAEG